MLCCSFVLLTCFLILNISYKAWNLVCFMLLFFLFVFSVKTGFYCTMSKWMFWYFQYPHGDLSYLVLTYCREKRQPAVVSVSVKVLFLNFVLGVDLNICDVTWISAALEKYMVYYNTHLMSNFMNLLRMGSDSHIHWRIAWL